MRRRDYGSGGLRRRGKRWQATLWLPRDPATHRRTRKSFTGATRKEALERRSAFQRRIEHGLDVVGAQSPLGEYFERWLREHAARSVSARTLAGYEQTGRVFVASIAAVPLADLRPWHIERALAVYLQSGWSNRTAAKHLTILKSALARAVMLKLILHNPASAVTKPRVLRREMRVVDMETLAAILDACDDPDFCRLINLAVHTGLRAGELLGLRWADVSWEHSLLQVRRTRNEFAKSGFAEPKTAAGRRAIALSTREVAILREHRASHNERRLALGPAWPRQRLVFPRPDGKPERVSTLSRKWSELCGRIGVADVRFHDLRHTSATIALLSGVHPKVVQERLGHSTIGVTLDTYSHVLPSMQEDAAHRIESAMSVLDDFPFDTRQPWPTSDPRRPQRGGWSASGATGDLRRYRRLDAELTPY